MYQVIHIIYRGNTEIHNIEEYGTLREAVSRFHLLIATDMADTTITYCCILVTDKHGVSLEQPYSYCETKDEGGEPLYPFNYAIMRLRIKNGTHSASIEYRNDEQAAYARYFETLAADLLDVDVTFNVSLIIAPNGKIQENRAFIDNN